MDYPHKPVLAQEVARYLLHRPAGFYVDGTVGMAGHSEIIGNGLSPEGRLLCVDTDPEAVGRARQRLAFLGDRVCVVQGSYAHIDLFLRDQGIKEVDGVLLDLGMSSYQIEQSGRGFSFGRSEPLDMRMDPQAPLTAGDLVNSLSSRELGDLLRTYGEEKRARSIARAIVKARGTSPISTSSQLAGLIATVIHPRAGLKHPATRSFQALRIAVNNEIKNLDIFLDKAPEILALGGRLVILSYHSLEDREVKRSMMDWEKGCDCPRDFPRCVCGKTPLFRRLLKKGLRASPEEIAENPRARSATLRAAERVKV